MSLGSEFEHRILKSYPHNQKLSTSFNHHDWAGALTRFIIGIPRNVSTMQEDYGPGAPETNTGRQLPFPCLPWLNPHELVKTLLGSPASTKGTRGEIPPRFCPASISWGSILEPETQNINVSLSQKNKSHQIFLGCFVLLNCHGKPMECSIKYIQIWGFYEIFLCIPFDTRKQPKHGSLRASKSSCRVGSSVTYLLLGSTGSKPTAQ